ncbi:MAG: tetratricopeptide repeat protein [Peptococcaceae bacterium]|nr:tetratricopeptide repeat protein [Peptococcaceae bacterium]
MDCWTVLAIEKTTDKDQVKKAYYAKLPHFHPEDDPEGFQKLKVAYDEAMAYEEEDAREEDTSDIGLWMTKVRSLYADFFRRIDVANWEELLDDPVVVSLAASLEARYQVLVFLLEHYRLPQAVFALLASTFSWKENHKDLTETFAANFIDYLLDQAENEGLRYELFVEEPGKDYERFVENYFTLFYNLIPPLELDKAADLIAETDTLDISHPDYTLQKIKNLLLSEAHDKLDQCLVLRDALLAEYPDKRTYYAAAHIAYGQEKFDDAISWLEKCLALGGSEYAHSARMLLADCLTSMELYEEALAKYEEIRADLPASDELFHRIRYLHIQLADQLKTAMPDDEAKLKYVSHCLAADNYDCEETAAAIDPAKVNRLEYCKTMGAVYGGLKKMSQAVPFFEEALIEVRGSRFEVRGEKAEPGDGQRDDPGRTPNPEPPDAEPPTPRTTPHNRELSELLSDYGWAYVENDVFEKAVELFDAAIEADPAFVRSYNRKAYALNKMERYREALVCCDVVLEQAPYMSAMLSKARALLGLGDHTGALAVADEAIAIALYQEAFRIKLECLYKMARYDEAVNLIEFLREKDSMSVEMLEFQALILMKLEENTEAEKVIAEILERDQGNFIALVQRSEIHCKKEEYDLAEAALDQISPEKAKPQAIVFAHCDLLAKMKKYDQAMVRLTDLLSSEPDAYKEEDIWLRLALLYDQHHEVYQETFGHGEDDFVLSSINYLKEVLRINPEHPFANRTISAKYFELGDYENSLVYVKRQVELSKKIKDVFLYGDFMNLALTYNRLGKDAVEEKQALDEALSLFPYDESLNNYAGAWHVEHGEHAKAYPHFQTALTYGNNDKEFWKNITQNLCVLERYEEGISVAAKAVAACPGVKYFQYREAWFYQLAGRFQEAIPLFQKWGENASDDDFFQESLIKVGDCHACMNDYPIALEVYNKALAANQKNAVLHLKIGYIYDLLQEDRKARKSYRKALLSNCCDDALHRLAMMAWRRGQKIRSRLLTTGLALYLSWKREDGDFFLLGQMYKVHGKYARALECFNKKIAKTQFCQTVCKSGCSESYYELTEIHQVLGNGEDARLCAEKAEEIARGRFGCGGGEFYS